MSGKKNNLLKYILLSGLVVVLIIAFIFIPRNPYLSNYLKRLILPEIQSATGYTAIADRIYLHIFPIYAGIKNLKFLDKNGNIVMQIDSIKVYPEISSLFVPKVFIIKRISVKGLSINMDEERFEYLKKNVEEYVNRPERGTPVFIRGLDISKGEFLWTQKDSGILIKGLSLKGRIREKMEINSLIEEVYLKELKIPFSLRTHLFISDKDNSKEIDLEEMAVSFKGSEIKLGGRFNTLSPSRLNVSINLLMGNISELFGLKPVSKDAGRLKAKGFVEINPSTITHAIDGESNSPGIDFIGAIKKSLDMNLNLTADMHLEELFRLLGVSEPISGRVSFEGNLLGMPEEPELNGRAILKRGELFGVLVDELITTVNYNNRRFTFTDAHALLYGGSAVAEAEIPLPVHTFRLYVKASAIKDKPLMKLIGLNLPLADGFVDGELSHSGKRFSPAGWFYYKSKNLESASIRKYAGGSLVAKVTGEEIISSVKEIRGDFFYNGEDNSLRFDNLEINFPLLLLKGEGIYRTKERYLDGYYELDLNPEAFQNLTSPILKFKSGEIKGDVRGILSEPSISGRIRLTSTSIKNYDLQIIDGIFRYTPEKMEVSIRGVSQDSVPKTTLEEHTLSGDIKFINPRGLFDFSNPEFSLKALFRGLRLKSIVGYRHSALFLDREPRLDGEALLIGDNSNQDINIKFKIARSYVDADFSIKKWKEYTYRIDSRIYTDDLEIIAPESLSTVLKIEGSGSGMLPGLKGHMRINAANVYISKKPLGSLSLDGVLSNADDENNGYRINFGGFLFSRLIGVKGEISLSEPFSYFLSLDFDADYKNLMHAIIKDAPEDSYLFVKGNLKLKGTGRLVSGNLYLDKFIVDAYGHQMHNEGPVYVVVDRNLIDIRSFKMINDGGFFIASGKGEIGQWIDLKIQGNTYLWPFKRFSRSINTLKGRSDFELVISGKWMSPKITGILSLKDGTIGIEGIPYFVTDVDCLLRFMKNRINIEYLNGKVAGGSIESKGVAYLKGFRLGRFNIIATLKDISARISEDFTMTFDSELYLKGERYLRLITGDVKIKRASYRKYIEWRSWMLKMRREISTPEISIPSYLDARLNIKITGGEGIEIDNNISRSTLRVDLLLKGTLQKPVLFGRVEAIEGTVYFRNNELRLIKAVADFTDPQTIDPYFRIKAETNVRGYRINIFMEGRIRRFNLSFFSEPPLDEVDIISLLAVGETATALKGYGGGIGAAEASSFITGQLQETIEQRARFYTGIDRIQISPYISKTGEVGPRVTVGKKIGERLSIFYSSAVGSKESDVIKIEYELSNRVSLVGEKDERGSIGGDVKFRFFFR